MQKSIARPDKTTGRVVLGPRPVRNGYARIVARADGSGRLEFYDSKTLRWSEVEEQCTFDDLWSAPSAFDSRHVLLA